MSNMDPFNALKVFVTYICCDGVCKGGWVRWQAGPEYSHVSHTVW